MKKIILLLMFSACQLFFSDIVVEGSGGVQFDHFNCGKHIKIFVKGGGGVLWPDEKGCYWLDPTDPYTLNWIISVINEVKAMASTRWYWANSGSPPRTRSSSTLTRPRHSGTP